MDQIVQIVGAVLVLVAYLLAQLDVLDARSYRYLVPNAVGSTAMAATAVVTADWGFVLLEGVWALVSYAGLVARLRGRSATGAPGAGQEARR